MSSGGDARKALLPLLQRATAKTYPDPYLQARVDLSYTDWLLLANDVEGLPAPLLDRVKLFRVGYPSGPHLRALLERQLGELDACGAAIDLLYAEFEAGRATLRTLDRIKSSLRQAMRRPILH